MQFYSQVGQDRYLLENFFKGKRDGVFVEVGAYDGKKFSNTLFFEETLGWKGLCIEPMPDAFARLVKNRKAICENFAVSNFRGEAEFLECEAGVDETMLSGLVDRFDPRHVQRIERAATKKSSIKVPVTTLASLLTKHSLYHIDYLSIDTEGAELSILDDLQFGMYSVGVLTIENNYGDNRLISFMADRGYDFVAQLEQDYVFKRRDIPRLPRTSVICAVWHGDPNRLELLRGHQENLAKQNAPIQPIYVFDGKDPIPSWLRGKAISVREPITMYQAWNVALSLVETPFVMNLNLDDRLAPDAVSLLETNLLREKADAIGGDWNIKYTQAETDAVEPCYPADRLPFVQGWPPAPGTVTRLGSGTFDRGCVGPVTMWRMDAHIGAPRFPWRMSDGTPLKGVADLAWWLILERTLKKKIARVPMVIGNYYSHPQSQAEFKPNAIDENALLYSGVGVSLL